MGGEREVQEERNGIRLGASFSPHWLPSYQEGATAKSEAKEKPQGSAPPPGAQPMGGEREVQEERNGIRLGASFSPHWRALLSRGRYFIPSSDLQSRT